MVYYKVYSTKESDEINYSPEDKTPTSTTNYDKWHAKHKGNEQKYWN